MTDTQLYEAMIDFNSFYVNYLSIKSNGRCTQKELSERLGIDAAYLSRMIRKLTEDGCLRKEANDADKRSHCYELTNSGKKIDKAV